MLLMLIGSASAASTWYPRSEDYTTTGDVNANDGTFSGDVTVTGNVTASGTSGITGDITGNVTATGTVQGEQITSTDDINATGTVFTADIVTSADATVGDDLSVAGHTDLDSLVVAGTARLNTTIVATGDTVTVTDADGLTVGGKIIPQEIVVTWPLSASSVDESVFIPTEGYNVTAVEVRYSVAASSGPTNVTLKKCTVGEAPASGDAITSAMLLNGTVNQVYSYTPIVGSEGITAADTLCLDYDGTMTALAGGTVTITLKRV